MKANQDSSYYAVRNESDSKAILDALPVAELRDLYADYGEPEMPRFDRISDKAVFCNNKHVGTVSQRYVLVQHREAFAPIIEALSGRDCQFSAWANNRRAFLGVLLGQANDTVRYGFRAENTVDGSTSIRYGLSARQHTTEVAIVEKERVLVWTYREVCSNGAKIKVPLRTERYLDTQTRHKFQDLVSEQRNIPHVGQVHDKLLVVQHLAEAFLLLAEPLKRMINDAKSINIAPLFAHQLIREYIGERMSKRIWNAYQREDEATLWSLFNSITGQASHAQLSDSTREALLEKASNLLTDELERYANEMPAIPA